MVIITDRGDFDAIRKLVAGSFACYSCDAVFASRKEFIDDVCADLATSLRGLRLINIGQSEEDMLTPTMAMFLMLLSYPAG
jgi:hypothetical protein